MNISGGSLLFHGTSASGSGGMFRAGGLPELTLCAPACYVMVWCSVDMNIFIYTYMYIEHYSIS